LEASSCNLGHYEGTTFATRRRALSAFGPRQAAATRKLPSQYTKVAFVSRASDADRRSRRRGDAARRSLLPKRQRSIRGLLTRPSSSGVDASAKAALAARQMRRVSWSRVSARGFSRVERFWKTTGTTCKNNFYAARNRPLRGFATRGEMRLRRSRQVGRGRRPSREAAARARANTPSEASAEFRGENVRAC